MDVSHLSPTYIADLRALLADGFALQRRVHAEPIPGGTISERIHSPVLLMRERRVVCAGVPPEDGDGDLAASVVRPATYWPLALPHSGFGVAMLLQVASSGLAGKERIAVEARVLAALRRRYRYVPIPLRILDPIHVLSGGAIGTAWVAWLDFAMTRMAAVETIDDAYAVRRLFRVEALRHGASGRWDQTRVAVAEFVVDYLLLSMAGRHDVEDAIRRRSAFGGSISLALASMDDAGATCTDASVRTLVQPVLRVGDLRAEELESLGRYAVARRPFWREGLLFPHTPRVESGASTAIHERSTPSSASAAAIVPPENAAETYARLRQELEGEIGRKELCRHLALIGLGALRGVSLQRVLLCGPTGTGKTHAARALARAIGRPVLQLDASDLTATGWKGLDLPDALENFASSAEGALSGVLHLDEIDKVRLRGDGNTLQAMVNLQASLLGLLDGQPVTPDTGRAQLDTSRLLIVGTGAFGGRFSAAAPSTEDLVRWGWMPEFAARWGERYCLAAPSRSEAIELLRSSERSPARRLEPLTSAIGVTIEVPESVLAYIVDRWLSSGADFRSASEWLLHAARIRLLRALEDGEAGAVTVWPDDLRIPIRPKRGGSQG